MKRSELFSFSMLLASGALGCSTGAEPLPQDIGAPSVTDRGASGGPVDPSAAGVLGDGTRESVRLELVLEPARAYSATDLDFNPARPGELWVVMRELGFMGDPCNQAAPDRQACALLEGTVAIIEDVAAADPLVTVTQDANAWHFMRRPPAIAFGDDDTFATCGEHRTGNYDDGPADFMGPTLWSSDPDVFGPHGPGGNGSHLDMLHATPFCMGIAHERNNVYWLFNGDVGAVDRYDFQAPHEPGGEDHSDGEASRWLLGELVRVPGVPSHLEYDERDGTLYIVDSGNGRVLRLDTDSGSLGGQMPSDDSQLGRVDVIEGASFEVIVEPGALTMPSGIARSGDVLYVTDHDTSRIHAFDLSGGALGSLDTGLPPETLAGIAIGTDGLVYVTDMQSGAVRRIVAQ